MGAFKKSNGLKAKYQKMMIVLIGGENGLGRLTD